MDELRKTLGERLVKAREQLSLSQQRAAELLGIDRPRLSGMERGERPVDAVMLAKLSQLYGVSASYLIGMEEALGSEASMRFRAVLAERSQGEVSGFLTFIKRYRRLLERANWKPVQPDLLHARGTSETRKYAVEGDAERLRNLWGLTNAPIGRRIFELLEDHGIGVYREAVAGSPVSGAYYEDDVVGPLIYVNASDWPYRQVFTAAHELAHLIYHRERHGMMGVSKRRDASSDEVLCNKFASAFLMPKAAIESYLSLREARHEPLSVADVVNLHRRFGVSYHAMLVRLRSLGILRAERYERYVQESPVREALDLGYPVADWELGYHSARVHHEVRLTWVPRRFAALVRLAVTEGWLSDRKAAEYLNMEYEEWLDLSFERKGVGTGFEQDREDAEFIVE
jgi:Zn-dependent peptidase ImmA (M78 family)/plasmid maintenance system antidote protein VapI